MKKSFQFDFQNLSFQDQKFLYVFLDAESLSPELVETASTVSELEACFEESERQTVSRLSYLAALLAHGVVRFIEFPIDQMGEQRTFVDVQYDGNVEFDFDITWYDGLNYDGYGLISLVATVEMYRLEELSQVFLKYSWFGSQLTDKG
jgi:hypothetical protein